MPPHHPHHEHHPHHHYSPYVVPDLDELLGIGDYDDEDVAAAFHDVLDEPIPAEWKAFIFFFVGTHRRLLREVSELSAELNAVRVPKKTKKATKPATPGRGPAAEHAEDQA